MSALRITVRKTASVAVPAAATAATSADSTGAELRKGRILLDAKLTQQANLLHLQCGEILGLILLLLEDTRGKTEIIGIKENISWGFSFVIVHYCKQAVLPQQPIALLLFGWIC